MDDIVERLGVACIVDAGGPFTRPGGWPMHPDAAVASPSRRGGGRHHHLGRVGGGRAPPG